MHHHRIFAVLASIALAEAKTLSYELQLQLNVKPLPQSPQFETHLVQLYELTQLHDVHASEIAFGNITGGVDIVDVQCRAYSDHQALDPIGDAITSSRPAKLSKESTVTVGALLCYAAPTRHKHHHSAGTTSATTTSKLGTSTTTTPKTMTSTAMTTSTGKVTTHTRETSTLKTRTRKASSTTIEGESGKKHHHGTPTDTSKGKHQHTVSTASTKKGKHRHAASKTSVKKGKHEHTSSTMSEHQGKHGPTVSTSAGATVTAGGKGKKHHTTSVNTDGGVKGKHHVSKTKTAKAHKTKSGKDGKTNDRHHKHTSVIESIIHHPTPLHHLTDKSTVVKHATQAETHTTTRS